MFEFVYEDEFDGVSLCESDHAEIVLLYVHGQLFEEGVAGDGHFFEDGQVEFDAAAVEDIDFDVFWVKVAFLA